jgi:hypothetical protein
MECYMCEAQANTREHVPPKAFFPGGCRQNLATVPSCETHNHAHSLDIEYVRNLIAGFYGVNAQGELVFEAAKRSYDRSPALFNRTFHDFDTVRFAGDETAKFTVDLERMKAVMRPIAHAVYFADFGRRFEPQWNVFVASMRSREDLAGLPSQWQPFRDLLATLQFVPRKVPYPEIFTYGIHQMDGGLVYRFVFYGSFRVHCFGPSKEFR